MNAPGTAVTGGGAFTADELMTACAARALRDGMTCFVGIGLPSVAANLARATHAHRFPAQRRAITHFDRRIKAIHVEVNDCSRLLFDLHEEISHNTRSRPSGVFSFPSQNSGFANRSSV